MAKKTSKKTTTTKTTTQTVTVPLVNVAEPTAPADYVSKNTAPVYTNTAVAPAEYKAGTYNSQYADRINAALDTVTNWKYDPMQDASYQALAKVYGARGNLAAKNSLADAAALNGGYGTSYAVSAAQQARNQYNQELASLIPDLESAAYNRASGTLSALRSADDTAYGRFRDTESDRQWKYTQDYTKYRDTVGDNQWKYSQDYNAYRDKEADDQWSWTQQYNKYRDMMGDYQWGVNFNNSNMLWAWEQQQALNAAANASKKGSSGGGGGRRSSGGGKSSGTSTSSSMPNLAEDYASMQNKKKKNSGSPNR